MPRFFVPSSGIEGDQIRIVGEDARHIARSLRMAEGDELTVCDMKGNEHECKLTRIRDEECLLSIIDTHCGKTEPPVEITLYMAFPKGDKLEVVVQKAVELGAARIVPFESERCIKRPGAERADKITARLARIAEEAAKQCGRSILPTVEKPISFKSAIAEAASADLPLFCYEGDGTRSLKDLLTEATDVRRVSVVVGCEGGFSRTEAESAEAAGLKMTNLGPRILRCETAPSYVLSALSYFFEL